MKVGGEKRTCPVFLHVYVDPVHMRYNVDVASIRLRQPLAGLDRTRQDPAQAIDPDEVGPRRGSSARRDPCAGRQATTVPTATALYWRCGRRAPHRSTNVGRRKAHLSLHLFRFLHHLVRRLRSMAAPKTTTIANDPGSGMLEL
jgi:hypothetical protein